MGGDERGGGSGEWEMEVEGGRMEDGGWRMEEGVVVFGGFSMRR